MSVPPAEEVNQTACERLKPIEQANSRGDSQVQRFYQGAVVLVTGGSGFLGKQLIEKLFRLIEQATSRGDSQVQRFYQGAVMLVTGGSGFLGKQLIDKLFRTFDIKKLYILLRAKKGKSVEQRLEAILSNPVYDTLRETRPWFVDKLEAVEGDICLHRLGLSDDTWQRLLDEVTMVFHCAATVTFMDPLKVAAEINVRGTLEMLDFGKCCKNLLAFVHVSTAYSQALSTRHNSDVLDQFSTSPMSPATLMELSSIMDQKTMDEISPKLGIGSLHPNTYSYTKAVAEEAVRAASADLPICVIRPTIVVPAYTEPSPGWTDINNVLGGSGIILGLDLGIIHVLLADPEIKVDIVPVDFVNNAAIVAGYETARRQRLGESECKVYTVGSSCRNAIKWAFLTDVLDNQARRHISPQAVWYAFAIQTTNKAIYFLMSWLIHIIPGYIVDAILVMMGKKPQATKIYSKIYRMGNVVSFFTLRSWRFKDDNTLELYNSLSQTDRQIFNMDIGNVDMKELVLLWNIGLRKFILKESLGNEQQSARKQFILKLATYAIAPLYIYVLYKIFTFVVYGLLNLFFW